MEETLMQLPFKIMSKLPPKHICVPAAFLLRTLRRFPATYSVTAKPYMSYKPLRDGLLLTSIAWL